MKVEVWRRKLRRLGFEGSISAWPEPDGNNLSVEAVPDDKGLESVQVVFKVGGVDNRTARELLTEFGKCLRGVYEQCKAQVLQVVPKDPVWHNATSVPIPRVIKYRSP